MLQETSARSVVYQVLDQVLADRAVSACSRRAIHSVIDDLREKKRPSVEVRRAESVAIEMHKLEWALQGNNDAASQADLNELKSLAVSWLDARICG